MTRRREYTRLGEPLYQRHEIVIILQPTRTAYRLARVCQISRGGHYSVRYWDWAKGGWSGKTEVARDSVICEFPGRTSDIESFALSLLAFANMRRAAIEQADEDMRLQVEQLIERLRDD